jgi:hypothetical protein
MPGIARPVAASDYFFRLAPHACSASVPLALRPLPGFTTATRLVTSVTWSAGGVKFLKPDAFGVKRRVSLCEAGDHKPFFL